MRFVYYPVAILSVIIAVSISIDAARLTAAACAQLNLAGSTDLAWKSLLETLTFSWYSGATESRQYIESLFAEAAYRDHVAQAIGFSLSILTLAHLMLVGWWGGKNIERRRTSLVAHMITVAVLFFVAGVIAPILSLRAYTEMPVLGTVVFKFQSKSILSTIGSLFGSGNLFVGVMIALFSVVTPVVKLVMMACVVQGWFPSWQKESLDVIKGIGKWSMADVFVVSILLAFLATQSDEFSDARLGLGLYLFAGYCLLSQLATHILLSGDAPAALGSAQDEPAVRDESAGR